MKSFVHSFSVFFLLFSFSILFVSCSQESTITSPNESKTASMAKATIIPTVAFNHSTDTVMTLPQSGKTLSLSKSYTANQIAQIDGFLATHTIKTKTLGMTPQLQNCADRTFTNWELENQYQPVSGKYLGIWTNDISIYQAHNQYGFTLLYVTSITDIDSGYNDHFSYDNMMYGLNLPGYSTDIQNSNSGGRHVGSYYIDEPIERGVWTPSLILDAASLTSKPVMLGSYKWPVVPQYYDIRINETFGQVYGPCISAANNLYIMCDEYRGNCLGHTYEYWNEFHGYYGASKNISNWMEVVANNGSGTSTSCGYAATSWITLLTTADGLGINHVWLYAYGTGDETAISNCCLSAWEDNWLYRQEKQLVTEWKCVQNNCTDCSYPTSGTWYLYDSYYTSSSQYVSY